jgi:integrase
MARPLRGTVTATPTGRYRAELPASRGQKGRIRRTFDTHAQAQAWRDAGIAALRRGEPVPHAHPADPAPRASVEVERADRFLTLGRAWQHEYYILLNRADAVREAAVERHIVTIDNWMRQRGLGLADMTRPHVVQLLLDLSGMTPTTPASAPSPPRSPAPHDPDLLLTRSQATIAFGLSRSTLQRRCDDGTLSPTIDAHGTHRYSAGDLHSLATATAGPGRPATGRKSQGHVKDIRWVFEQVAGYAHDLGVPVPQDRASLRNPRVRDSRTTRATRTVLDFRDVARLAAHLHAVHQTTLWLTAVLGLRISETYGIRVSDAIDEGPGRPGLVRVHAQGGRTFTVRNEDGSRGTAHHVEHGKTEDSARVLVAPPALMDLLRTVIAVFHTDSDGNVNARARLVPGLSRADEAGQAAFRHALRAAGEAEQVAVGTDEEEPITVAPHQLRGSLITQLTWSEGLSPEGRRRFSGHAAGDDVHARHYIADDPELRPMKAAAAQLEQLIAAQVPDGLTVPTPVRCTTGNQRALAPYAGRIDDGLIEAGWLTPSDDDGEPMLDADQVAALLDIAPVVARRWMKDGRLPSEVSAPRARGAQRKARLCDVEQLRLELHERITITSLAEETGRTYHQVYAAVTAHGANTDTDAGLSDETAELVRAHFAHLDAIDAAAVTLDVAAEQIGCSVDVIRGLIQRGTLVDHQRLPNGRRTVTRASVESYLANPPRSRRRARR